MENKKNRDCNFELLRIVSMIMIIMHHYVVHSDFVNIPVSFNKMIAILFSFLGKVGVNIFIMISGYYLLNSKFKIKKVLKLILEVYFYDILIFILIFIYDKNQISTKMIIKSILPITYALYWFVTPYIWLYVLSPYVVKFIKSLRQNEYIKLLIIMTISLSIIPTFIPKSETIVSNFVWFLYLYLLATYIKLFNINILKHEMKIKICVMVLLFILVIAFILIFQFIEDGEKIDLFVEHVTKMNSVFCLILSLIIFLYFKNINIQENKLILFFSNKSFAVYLIHDNPLIRNFLWFEVLKINQKYSINPILFIIEVLTVSFTIYILGSIIEYFRTTILEKRMLNDKYIDILERKLNINE